MRPVRKMLQTSGAKYLLVGGSSVLLEYASFNILQFLGVALVLSNVLSFLAALVYTFVFHRKWTFGDGPHAHSGMKQMTAYLALAVFNLIATSVLISALVHGLKLPPFIAKAVCMAAVALWNFALLNKVIFKRESKS